jgi:hypothetical protein
MGCNFFNNCNVLPSPLPHHLSIHRLLDESYVPLDPSTIPSTISAAGDTKNKNTAKQLWLFQVPLDFEIGRQVTWKLNPNNTNLATTSNSNIDSIQASCLIDGVPYQLSSDQDLPSARLFAVAPGSGGGGNGPIPIVKKLTVSRKSDAQRTCFGIGGGEEVEGDDDAVDGEEEEEEEEKQSKRRRKKKEALGDEGGGGGIRGDRKKRKKRKSKE